MTFFGSCSLVSMSWKVTLPRVVIGYQHTLPRHVESTGTWTVEQCTSVGRTQIDLDSLAAITNSNISVEGKVKYAFDRISGTEG